MSSNTSNAKPPVRSTRESYNAYQRKLMRKRRAARKEAKAAGANPVVEPVKFRPMPGSKQDIQRWSREFRVSDEFVADLTARDLSDWQEYSHCSINHQLGRVCEVIETLAARPHPTHKRLIDAYAEFMDSSPGIDDTVLRAAVRRSDPDNVARALGWMVALVNAQLKASMEKRGPLARALRLGDAAQYLPGNQSPAKSRRPALRGQDREHGDGSPESPPVSG